MRLPMTIGVLLTVVTGAAAQNIEFDSPWRAYDLGYYPEGGPWDAELADFDGDGLLDLASVSWATINGRLATLRGNGRGGLERLDRYPLREPSMGMTVADFDGDSDLDIAVANTGLLWDGSSVSVFLNQGAGTFVEQGPFFAGVGPTGITSGDYDGDGDQDLAVAHDNFITTGTSYAVLLNNGAGSFGPPRIKTTANSTYQIETADMNADGRPDLVVAGEMHDVMVVLNTEFGFAPPVPYLAMPTAFFDQYPALELADVDLDGDIDVLYSASRAATGPFVGVGQVGLLRNNGNGSLQALELIPLLFGEGGAVGIHVDDVTEDGWPDILVASAAWDWWGLMRGDGGGGFLSVEKFRSGDAPIVTPTGDLDGDGVRDVVAVASGSVTAAVHLNSGGGGFATQPFVEIVTQENAPAFYSQASSSDLDGDGDVDVAIGFSLNFESRYGVALVFNRGDGTFDPPRFHWTPTFPELFEVVDLNGDGFDDLVWADDNFPFQTGFAFNRGDGTFGLPQVGPSLPTVADCLHLADVDGDGDHDLLIGGTLDLVHVARNNGTGFDPFYGLAINNIARAMASTDLDGDGDIDLVTNSGIQGWLEVCLGNGDGTFQGPWTVQTGPAVGAIAIADFNGDGVPDIATGNNGNATISVLIGRGPGLFKPAVSYPSGQTGYQGFQSILAVDVDGDADVDLVAGNFGAQDISVLRNRGDGTFEAQARPGVGHGVWDVEFRDFTGDGVADLLAQVEPEASNGPFRPAISLVRGTAGDAWTNVGNGLAGTHGTPVHRGLSSFQPGLPFVLRVENALESTAGALVLGVSQINLPLLGGVLVPDPVLAVPIVTDVFGSWVFSTPWAAGIPSGATIVTQAWIVDSLAVGGVAATNGLVALTP